MTGPRPFGGKSPKPLPWRPLPFMEEWLENLRIDEKSDTYIRSAKVGITHFALFAEKEGIKHPEEITRTHILRFQAHLLECRREDGKPFMLSYRQAIMRKVQAWIRWMLDVEHIEQNPWVRIRVGQVTKKPKPLENDEVELLFHAHRQQAFSIPAFFYHRREVILVLLYGWGLRREELRSLTVTAMDMRLDWVTVRNKGGGTKTLPYGDELKTVVQRYLAQRGKHAVISDDSLLIDQNGKQMSNQMIYKIITELGARAGVSINPHRLRDTFGTTMLDNDVEVERIMKMMGHTQRKQTLQYARVNDHKVKESHDEVMNPLIHRLLGGELP